MTAPLRLDLAAHPWMTGPAVSAVMDALGPGDADRARFVGGCVRNALQGLQVSDIDIATQLPPDAVLTALEAAGVRVEPTGIEHGTVTAVVSGQPFEITSLRKDVETFGRRAVVAFTDDWAEDAARRDFRLNAVYARRDGSLYDPFGGIEDALAGRVIFIGEARERIGEDHLRILRFYRFNAWYGAAIDPDGHRACSEMAASLSLLSAERVWKELKKLLAAPDPGAAVRAMHEGHVLQVLFPGHLDLNLFLSLINRDRGRSRPVDPLLRIAALTGQDKEMAHTLSKRMKASRAESDRLTAMTRALPADVSGLRPGMEAGLRARALYRLGRQAVIDRLRLAEAAGGGEAQADLDFAETWRRPDFPVKGADLQRAGFSQGPALGSTLKRLEEDWIASGFTLSRDELLARAGEAGP